MGLLSKIYSAAASSSDRIPTRKKRRQKRARSIGPFTAREYKVKRVTKKNETFVTLTPKAKWKKYGYTKRFLKKDLKTGRVFTRKTGGEWKLHTKLEFHKRKLGWGEPKGLLWNTGGGCFVIGKKQKFPCDDDYQRKMGKEKWAKEIYRFRNTQKAHFKMPVKIRGRKEFLRVMKRPGVKFAYVDVMKEVPTSSRWFD